MRRPVDTRRRRRGHCDVRGQLADQRLAQNLRGLQRRRQLRRLAVKPVERAGPVPRDAEGEHALELRVRTRIHLGACTDDQRGANRLDRAISCHGKGCPFGKKSLAVTKTKRCGRRASASVRPTGTSIWLPICEVASAPAHDDHRERRTGGLDRPGLHIRRSVPQGPEHEGRVRRPGDDGPTSC